MYNELPGKNRDKNLCQAAIDAYKNASKVYYELELFNEYAHSQNGLGIAYKKFSKIIAGDKNENIHNAIEAYNEALN